MRRNLIFYAVLIGIFGSLLWFVFNQGAKAEAQQSRPMSAQSAQAERATPEGAVAAFISDLSQKMGDPLSLLLLQIVTIVLSSKLLASLAGRIGQPVVIGEIVAGRHEIRILELRTATMDSPVVLGDPDHRGEDCALGP